MAPGYVYAVCRQGDLSGAKLGYTTSLVPEAYINANYSRSMSPLQVLGVVPCANARLSEKVLFHLLHKRRLHPRHEVFDLSDGLQQLADAFQYLRDMDARTELPTALDRPVSLLYHQVAKQAANVALRRQRKREREAEAITLREDQLRVRRELQKRIAISQEQARVKAEEAREAAKQVFVDELTQHVQEHLKEFVTQGQRKDFFRLIELEAAYTTDYPIWKQNDHWDVMAFRSVVCSCLGDVQAKTKHNYRDSRGVKSVRMVVLGYKLIDA